jgi:hypothetical protein
VASSEPDVTQAGGGPEQIGPPPLAGVRRITAVAIALWLLIVGLGYGLGATDFSIGVAVGGAIAVANFQFLWRSAAGKLEGVPVGAGAVWAVLRYSGLGIALVAAMGLFRVDPAGLLVGLTVVVAAIGFAVITGFVRG